ncbi:MAG TPA: pyridoxamine 5'-phosphate oxidase family protein [Dehalococcoidia bacterium]|nr:pyridoxamine 5'-phosphate oxidase family protein [Dehalococcoidia bacterium]
MSSTGREPQDPIVQRPHMPGYGLEKVTARPLPWDWAEERLRASHNYFVSTVSPDGRPHCVPVWGVWTGGMFFFSSGPRSRKARNLASSPRCVVCTEGGREAVIVQGEAEEVRDEATFSHFADAYEAKYNYRPQQGADLVFAVRPEVAFGFVESEDFPATATRWRFGAPRGTGRT